MIKVAPVLALLAGAMLLPPIHAALAITTESATGDSGDNAPVTDLDDQLDEMANPDWGTGGSAAIALPPIDIPGDSDDYTPPPDSEDDPTQDAPASGLGN
jgi:hypothetical protein